MKKKKGKQPDDKVVSQQIKYKNVTPNTFFGTSPFENFLTDNMFHLDKVKYWFKLDNLGITNPVV